MATGMTNEQAWIELFSKYDIANAVNQDGLFQISAEQIKEFREPRLMTKFDHRSQLPSVFLPQQLSILPTSRGDYIIGDMNTFQALTDNPNVQLVEKTIPANIESIDFSAITSEALAINCAYVSNILSDFTEQENLLPTVSGRMKSDNFSFTIERNNSGLPPHNIDVNNSQIEIDGGYEGETSLVLLEAKNNLCSDFMVRQLYYPYRKWERRVRKNVRPVFLEYSNGIFHLREYTFVDPYKYNSLVLVKDKKYRLRDAELHINTEVLLNLLNSTSLKPEPSAPFPQADSFERVIGLCEVIYNREEDTYTKDVIGDNTNFTLQPNFTARQVDYYTNAGLYLGLVEKVENSKPVEFVLSELGMNILSTRSITERQLKYIKCIISYQVFARVLRLYLENGEVPSKEQIISIMREANLNNMGTDAMYFRRASTVKSWVDWIIRTMDE